MKLYQNNRFQLNEFNIISLFFLLLPIGLVTGPFIPDLIVSLGSLYFIFIFYKKKLFKIITSKIVICMILFNLYLVIRSLYSENIMLSLESALFYFRFSFFVLLIIYVILLNENIIKYFKFSLLITIIVILFDGYYQFFTGYNLLGYGAHNYSTNTLRFSGMFGDEMVLGKFLLHIVPLYIALSFYKKTSIKLVYTNTLLIIVTLILIFLSGERTSFFLFLILSLLFFIFTDLKKIILPSVFIIFLLLVLTTLMNPRVQERVFQTTFNELYNEKGEIHFITVAHQNHAITAFKMFLDNPLFGQGPKMFREKCSELKYNSGIHSCSTHPHNYYLQLLAELGLIGVIPIIFIFAMMIYFLLIYAKKMWFDANTNKSNYEIGLIIIILTSLFPLAPGMNFFNNWVSILLYLPLPFLLFPYFRLLYTH
ncbi:MAG: hypothetical protein CML94_00505 [Rhodobiaceae bacterium]|nr:hypothetical protein [Rhodobiaceae bacterium]